MNPDFLAGHLHRDLVLLQAGEFRADVKTALVRVDVYRWLERVALGKPIVPSAALLGMAEEQAERLERLLGSMDLDSHGGLL
jgi:hypothetical protein